MHRRAAAIPAPRRGAAVRKRTTLKKRIKTALALVLLLLLTGLAIGVIYAILLFIQVSRSLPTLAELGTFKPAEGTRIYFADGPLMAVIAMENRRPIKLKEMGKHLVDAVIAIEDSRYYEHRGVDVQGIARAVYKNVTTGDIKGEGASTITQQLVRNLEELGVGRQKRLSRKVAEAILAIKIEQSYAKDEILELYLNQVYFGNGAHGAEAAALTFFHRRAKNLTLSQAALLAGMVQRPSYFSRPRHFEDAIHRRNAVLERMVETGKITRAEAEKAKAEKLKIYKAVPHGTRVYGAPYFVNYVVSQLVSQANGTGYGPDAIYGGWKIYTTLDSRIQEAAENALRAGILSRSSPANQGALVCIDPRTGYIRAMVGGVDYKRDQFNAVIQGKRQPGSAFKPIVYTAAIDSGVASLSKSYRDDPSLPGGKRRDGWYPKNYSGKYSYGYMTVLSAIKQSVNTVAVKVGMETGLRRVIDYAHRMGISTELAPYPPLSLGASAVRPIDLCSAYSVFAVGDGRRPLPMGIRTIIAPTGETIEQRTPEYMNTGIQEETLAEMRKALREAVLHGTGTRAADVPEACGKTGTTSDNRDAWFAGWTPDLVAVVWAARENRLPNGKINPKKPYYEMPGATGGHLCAPIWKNFMLKALPIQQAWNRSQKRERMKEVPLKKEPEKKPEETDNPDAPVAPPETTAPAAATDVGTAPAAEPSVPETEGGETVPGAAPAGPPAEPAQPPEGAARRIPEPTASAPTTQIDPRIEAPVFRSETPIARPAASRIEGPGTRAAEPTGRVVAPRPRPEDELISVRLCADSGRRATQWCDSYVTRQMRRGRAPGPCRLHRPPPGEG